MNPRDVGFNAHEKVEILAEIIKAGNVHPDMLVQFIRNNGLLPDWGNVALPRGRTLNQCMNWYNSVVPQAGPSGPTSGIVRSQSVRDPGATLKRPYNPDPSYAGGRPIVPRPPTSNIGNLLNEPPPSEPPRKKRGRPTKLELEARREAALARGTMLAGPVAAPVVGPSFATAAAQRAMTPRPPEPPGSAGASESSSAKKRGRPSKADMEARRLQEEARIRDAATGVDLVSSHYPNILSAESDEGETGARGGRGEKRPQDSPSRTDPVGHR